MKFRAVDGPMAGTVLTEAVDGQPPTHTIRIGGPVSVETVRFGTYGLAFQVPAGFGPWELVYQWQGWARV